MDDPIIVRTLWLAGGVILLVVLVVIFGPRMGGKPTRYVDPGGDSPDGGGD